ncbi:hypothetical protein SZMC14600_15745 [Saccharomonospora azurea SZMC 14600]|nr:hypothetical protein SZMC14600_15745 [Saccharomonospora azurea SZMC 14600]
MLGALPRDGRHAEDGEDDAHDLPAAQPFPQQQRTEDDGERRRGLQHERRESSRHAGVHGDEQERELQRGEPEAVPDQPPDADFRPRHEDHRGQGDEHEADAAREQRWEVREHRVDREEVAAPEDGGEHGEKSIEAWHGSSIARNTVKDHRE